MCAPIFMNYNMGPLVKLTTKTYKGIVVHETLVCLRIFFPLTTNYEGISSSTECISSHLTDDIPLWKSVKHLLDVHCHQ